MKKLLIFALVFVLLFCGCESRDYLSMLYFNDGYFVEANTVLTFLPEGYKNSGKVLKTVSSSEEPPEENGASNSLAAGTPLYFNADSPEFIYAEVEDNKFILFISFKEYSAEESALTASGSTSSNYSGCITPESEKQYDSSAPSVSHSTDTSANFSNNSAYSQSLSDSSNISISSMPENEISGTESPGYRVPKGLLVPKIPEYFFAEPVLGTESDLERWKKAVLNTDEICEINITTLPGSVAERELSGEEVTSVLKELQNVSPKIYNEPENPATGGGYSVAAYGFDGNLLWYVSDSGWFCIGFPENEYLLIFDPNDIYLESVRKICG